LNSRTSEMSDPIIIDAKLMIALESYVGVNVDEVSCLIAKFLNLFVTDSHFLEPYEVDNFILRNGRAVSAWYEHIVLIHLNRGSSSYSARGTSTTSNVTIFQAYESRFFFAFLWSIHSLSKLF
jgi:hypothetical protein